MTLKRLLLSVTLLLFVSYSLCQLSTEKEILDQTAAVIQQDQELAKQVNKVKKEYEFYKKRADDLVLDSLVQIC